MKLIYKVAIVISFFIVSCNKEEDSKQQYQYIRTLFSNGKVLREGNTLYSKTKKDSINIGVWKHYFPDGKLRKELEYDNDGIGIRHNIYSDVGVLIESGIKKDNLWFYHYYYDSGILKEETVVSTITQQEDESETRYSKKYYSSGKPWQELRYVDDELDGKQKTWDLSGKLVLEENYSMGKIQLNK
jgi:antitoxin component YwqK of YwqJK toxin-antitoxin module